MIDVLVRKNGSQEEYDMCQNSEIEVNQVVAQQDII